MLLSNLFLLAVDVPTLDHSLSDVAGKDNFAPGDYTDVVHFYHQWATHLHGNLGIWHSVYGTFANPMIKLFYAIVSGLDKVFNSVFSILGWDGTLSAKGSPLHALYMVISTIGWALLGASIIILALQSLTHTVRWGKVLPNIFMVSLTLTVLPLLMRTVNGQSRTVGNIVVTAKNDINKAAGNDNGASAADLAIQPIKNNVIDMARIANKGWKYDPNNINPSSTNSIRTKTDVNNLDLGASMDPKSLKQFKGFDKKIAGKGDNKVSEPFKYHLITNKGADASQETSYSLVKNENGTGMGNLNDYSYTRYDVEWLPLTAQSIILGIIYVVAAFRVVKDIFELTLMNLIAPLLAYKSTRSTKTLRDLISSIIGLYLSIDIMFLVIKVFMIFLGSFPDKLSGLSLNFFQKGMVIAIIYAAAGYAMFAGVSYFERVTGVSQGFSASTGQIMAAGAAGVAAGAAGVKLAKAAGSMLNNGVTRLGNSSVFSGISNSNKDSKAHAPSSSNLSNDNKNESNPVNSSDVDLNSDTHNNSDNKNDLNHQDGSKDTTHNSENNSDNHNNSDSQNVEENSGNSNLDENNAATSEQDSSTHLGDENTDATNDEDQDIANELDETNPASIDYGMDQNPDQDIDNVDGSDNQLNQDLGDDYANISNNENQDIDNQLSQDDPSGVDYGADQNLNQDESPANYTDSYQDSNPETNQDADNANGYNDPITQNPDDGYTDIYNGYTDYPYDNQGGYDPNQVSDTVDSYENPMNQDLSNGHTDFPDNQVESSSNQIDGTQVDNAADNYPPAIPDSPQPNFDFSKDVKNPVDPSSNTSNIVNNSVDKTNQSFTDKMGDISKNYLRNRNFNLSPKGNVHGVDSEKFEDE
ncbi:pLS20_p028 family conjugation system transmembrane protein [Ligilactobacillus salivarius]|uniref:pLS20_p028 family conjugation system transmembrane protein n=1 Tax=Ligilactobacillus salivarius TaxID=1624 RepID=UPI003F8915E8